MAAGLAAESARITIRVTGMPHYRFNDPQVATLSGFLLAKTDSDLLANVHLEPGNAGADRARQAPGFRLRLRFVSRNRGHQEAGELRT